ncbi:MAG: HAMP domain-containing sensor histidine kinase [Candidatus Omnitrophota bacterium]
MNKTFCAGMEMMGEGFICADENRGITVMNKKAKEMLSSLQTVREGDNLFDVLKKFETRESLEELFARNEPSEFRIYSHAHKLFYSILMKKIEEGNNRHIFVLILKDVSWQHYTDNLKAVFVSTISHKLRTPLTVAKEGLALLNDGILGELTQKQKDIVERAYNQASYLAMLINGLLDFAKIEADIMVVGLNKREILLKDIFLDIFKSMEFFLKKKKIEYSLSLPWDITLTVDAELFKTAISNIIDNAVKFNPAGTKIEIKAEKIKKAAVEISISDNGEGIPENMLPYIFESFTQVDKDMAGQIKGMGLGLYLAREIIKAHEGGIICKSEHGNGSEFIIRIPCKESY